MAGRKERGERSPGALLFLVLAAIIVGGVTVWGWMLDRQLRDGILTQRREAVRRPDWVPLRSLPGYVPEAFLVVVDPSFLERDPLRDGSTGTTIPRELIGQIYQLDEDVRGAGQELFMGPLLLRHLTRREALELYLNRMYLGEDDGWPIFGVYHAAREYFGKHPRELTLGEAATLAGLLLPPRIMDPGNRPGAVGARRNEVLRRLRAEATIGDDAYRSAIAEPLGFQPGPEYAPMARPADWMREPEVIRVPASPRPPEDTGEP